MKKLLLLSHAQLLSLCSLLSLATLGACASEPAARYTVQADTIAKTDLSGVWYFRQTVIGVPFTTGFTFIGEQGDNEMEKIVWDIQEDVLTARRSYEFVRGSEKNEPSTGAGPTQQYQGAPVAAFRIKSHFDIVREYNSSTGEEYNKIVENTERPWYQRKFMHVDWSENLVSNFQFLADYDHGGISAIRQDPVPYFVSDPADPDAMRVERPSAKADANYLEITQKITASPESVDFIDETNVPLCMLEYSTQDCASQELKIRNSFMRVADRDKDYDAMAYDDHMMERFGYFTTERNAYNRQYGETESGRVRLINRFNIWQHNLSTTLCHVDTDCGAAPLASGVRCDREVQQAATDPVDGSITGLCTLPYASRNHQDPKNPASADLGPRKIVYYLNDSYPADLVGQAQHLADEYDATFKTVYKDLMGADAPGRMYVLCANNPVKAGDSPDCGAVGTHPRIGDIRYNMIYWVDEPNNGGLLGYGPGNHDPETGETISATAFVYGAGVDDYAAYSRDIVRLENGDIAPDKFVQGVNVQDWVNQTLHGSRSKTFSQPEVDAAAANMNTAWMKGLPKTPAMRPGAAKLQLDIRAARHAAFKASTMLGADPGLASRRLSRLKGTDLEKQLATGEIMLARGLDPRSQPADVDMKQVAPLSLVNPERARAVEMQRRHLRAKGVDMRETFDDAIYGLAMQQKGKDPQEVWKAIRGEVFRSTAEHETGHTLGLRHNFAGSFDAMNYPKQYWDLRTAGGHVPQPRYLDPESPAELTGVTTASGLQAGISEFQTSSIMDYGAKFNTDIQGIGKYDVAALKFGYGQVVEVFNTTRDSYLLGALQATVTFGLPQPITTKCKTDDWISVPYTQLPAIVDLEDRTDVPFSSITNSAIRTDCNYPDSVDHTADKRLVVPYRFCSDEFEGAATDCQMFDRGADIYEQAENYISTYKNYYLFNNFKRDRLGFSPDGYLDRIYERYLDPLRSQMQFYVLFRGDYADAIPDDGTPTNFWHSATGWGPYTVAVQEGFNLLGDILTMPAPGPYYEYLQQDGRNAFQQDDYGTGRAAFTIPIPQGRYQTTEWDYDSGYFWDQRVLHVGVFLDKVAALGELTDPETYFLGKDEATDVRQYSINYWRLYDKQMSNVWGAAMTDRWDQLSPVFDGTKIVPRPISDLTAIPTSPSSPIDPQIGFSVELYAATLGIALIPETFDPTFIDSSRIFLAGNGQAITPTKPTVTFTDPYSGRVYTAVSFKQGAVETGVAARMMARANDLKAMLSPTDPSTDAALKSYIGVIEMQRTLSIAYGDALQAEY